MTPRAERDHRYDTSEKRRTRQRDAWPVRITIIPMIEGVHPHGAADGPPSRVRLLLPVACLVGLLSACATPFPTSVSDVPSAPPQSVQATITEVPSPSPSASPQQALPPFDGVAPEEGWVVLVSYDLSLGEFDRYALGRPVRARAPLHLFYACLGAHDIRLTVFEAAPPAAGGPDVSSLTEMCVPEVKLWTTTAPSTQRWFDIRIRAPVDIHAPAPARYWVVVTVPANDVVPDT